MASVKAEPSSSTVLDGDSSATSSTVYINNLNEKVKLPILKTSLEALFSVYGQVLSITAHDSLRMRGQAFVAFEDNSLAAKAVKEVNGFPLYGKPMQLSFAKTPSDAVILKQAGGSTESPQFQSHKSSRLARKPEIREADEQQKAKIKRDKKKAKKSRSGKGGVKRKREGEEDGPELGSNKRNIPQMPDEYLPPNPVLFLQNLPETVVGTLAIRKEDLESLFGSFGGFQDVRTIPGKAIAFVEFGNAGQAASAREALNGKMIGEGGEARAIRITFARA
jgi:U2 small nuclear ribonucleoprotein B''